MKPVRLTDREPDQPSFQLPPQLRGASHDNPADRFEFPWAIRFFDNDIALYVRLMTMTGRWVGWTWMQLLRELS